MCGEITVVSCSAAAVPDPVPQPDGEARRGRSTGVRGGGRDSHWHRLEEGRGHPRPQPGDQV